jgi:hypothetical protein
MGIRVSEEEEIEGLDISEHGSHAYDFDMGGAVTDPRLGGAAPTAAGLHLSTLATEEK